MDAIDTGLESFAHLQVPNHRLWHENSLRKLGLFFMLSGASTVHLTIGRSSAHHDCRLLGFGLLLFGFILLILSEFCDLGVSDGFPPARNEPNRRQWLEESLRRYGLTLMLFAASIVLTIANSTAAYNPEHALLGITLFMFGLLLVFLSEFRGVGAGEWFMRQIVRALDKFFGQH